MDIDMPASKAAPGDKPSVATTTATAVPPTEAELAALLAADIAQQCQLLEKSVQQLEKRFTIRVLRSIPSLRKRLTSALLHKAVEANLAKDDAVRTLLTASYLDKASAMDVDGTSSTTAAPVAALPEVAVYFGLLAMILLLDKKEYDKGLRLATEMVALVQKFNRRTLDTLAASVYFYYARFYECLGRLAECRPVLLAAQRTATIRHDSECQATLLNLLLRNYLHYNLFDQADKLVAKASLPETAGNNQLARYMYYTGLIKATQLDYTSAHRHLMQAARKAPQNASTAGFQQVVHKVSIVVQLLMGEIPERSLFRQASLRRALMPYFHIVQAVRIGDLAQFQQTLAKYDAKFKQDKTYTLILRLRHNVIKTGLRMICIAYSRISLRDICLKLHLDSEEDAEFIISKAIRDGVIDATVDHEHGYVKSKEVLDVYSTQEPQHAFHQRITFCLNLHNESVKAMRYPANAVKKEFEVDQDLRDFEREIVDMAADDMDEDDGDDF